MELNSNLFTSTINNVQETKYNIIIYNIMYICKMCKLNIFV